MRKSIKVTVKKGSLGQQKNKLIENKIRVDNK
jgi:hypothetical protein